MATPISLSALNPPMPGPCPARGSTTTNGRSFGSITTPAGGNDARKHVVDRAPQRASVDDELGFIVEHVRRCLRHVLAVLVAALPHHVAEQDARAATRRSRIPWGQGARMA